MKFFLRDPLDLRQRRPHWPSEPDLSNVAALQAKPTPTHGKASRKRLDSLSGDRIRGGRSACTSDPPPSQERSQGWVTPVRDLQLVKVQAGVLLEPDDEDGLSQSGCACRLCLVSFDSIAVRALSRRPWQDYDGILTAVAGPGKIDSVLSVSDFRSALGIRLA